MHASFLTLASFLETGAAIPIVMAFVGGTIAIISIISSSLRKATETRQLEESRREIAAYVAEGSMTAEDAFKLLSAKPQTDRACAEA